MIYIDANVFIFAFADNGQNGEFSRKILEIVESQSIAAATSSLTIDEVLWSLSKEIPKKEAILACRTILKIKGLRVLNIDKKIILESLNIVEKYNLKPRDSIHVAAMILNKINEIVSSDSDFDNVKEIKRYGINIFYNNYN